MDKWSEGQWFKKGFVNEGFYLFIYFFFIPILNSHHTATEINRRKSKMPCLNLSTNVNLEGVDTSSILSEATSSVASITGKPEAVRISFGSLI